MQSGTVLGGGIQHPHMNEEKVYEALTTRARDATDRYICDTSQTTILRSRASEYNNVPQSSRRMPPE